MKFKLSWILAKINTNPIIFSNYTVLFSLRFFLIFNTFRLHNSLIVNYISTIKTTFMVSKTTFMVSKTTSMVSKNYFYGV